jgi:hypothetical protein
MLAMAYTPSTDRDLGPSRYVIGWWFVFALLVTTAYSCGLSSHLTLPRNNPPLDSVRDLVEAGLHWGHAYFPTVDIIFDKNVRILIYIAYIRRNSIYHYLDFTFASWISALQICKSKELVLLYTLRNAM